jgi:ATP-binding cassette subfamily C (CFTR/MRP) protein 1
VRTAASLSADILGLVATLGACLLSRLEHYRSIRPSTLLAAYLRASVLLGLARLRTLCLIPSAVGAAVASGLALATMQCLSCFDRIQDYCNLPEDIHLAMSEATGQSDLGQDLQFKSLHSPRGEVRTSMTQHVVCFSKQNFSWSRAGQAVLHSISLELTAGRVTMIMGATASGKSTLLQSVLGETHEVGGQTERHFSTAAYCSQVPMAEDGHDPREHNGTISARA